MMTSKEFAQAHKARAERAACMNGARSWMSSDRKYTNEKTCRKYAKDSVKNARKANRKLVAALAAGSARPVSLVLATVLPIMEIMAKDAADRSAQHVKNVIAKVAAEGIDVAYPEAASLSQNDLWNRTKRAARDRQNARRSFAMMVTGDKADDFTTKYIADEVYGARAQFLAYADKLVLKVGAIKSAELEMVRGVWGESYLNVVTAEGVAIIWKTQTIVNRSVLDNLFYQWPTRIVKG